MNSFMVILRAWLTEFFGFFIAFLPIWLSAWALCLLVLIALFRFLRPRLRSWISAFDENLRACASRLRYRPQKPDEPNAALSERVLLSWFFRFWTNFASAPSLSVLAFVIPIWFFSQRYFLSNETAFEETQKWLLPTFCYFGSMGLSYALKRVVKRPRPVRDAGAFGHRLRDGSFPSGHSLTAFCFWIPMIAVVAAGTTVMTYLAFAAVAILTVLLTGISRIYMAVHWPSDVFGGFAIGAVWTALFLITCSNWFLG